MKWIVLWIVLGGGPTADAPNVKKAAKLPSSETAAVTDRHAHDLRETAAPAAKVNERSITAIRRDVSTALRFEAKSKDETPAHHKAIGALIQLHREIVRHTTFEHGFAMKESRALLQSRLVRIEREIRKRYNSPRSERLSGKSDVPSKRLPGIALNDQPVLAQRMVPNGGQPGAFGMGQGGAGLGNGGGIAPRGVGGQLPDFGPELADLIQQVIDPDFWDVNGGPGTIVYYQPLKALVVSATIEVHERLAGVAGQLRAAP